MDRHRCSSVREDLLKSMQLTSDYKPLRTLSYNISQTSDVCGHTSLCQNQRCRKGLVILIRLVQSTATVGISDSRDIIHKKITCFVDIAAVRPISHPPLRTKKRSGPILCQIRRWTTTNGSPGSDVDHGTDPNV